ncbi:MAG: prefoldin subunit alpha [Halobacteriales archaeon]|nr:prefoldin subunit alpha [Halobacteriales archaeon]
MMGQDAEAQLREAMQAGELLQGQLANIEEQLAYLSAAQQELSRGRLALETIGDAKPNEEVLLPLGGGAFAPAKLAGTGKVLLHIGAGYHIEVPPAQAAERLDEQLGRAREASQRLSQEGQQVQEQLQALEQHVQTLAR